MTGAVTSLAARGATGAVDFVLAGCPVLRAVVDRVRTERRVDHDGLVALRHAIGHLPGGPERFNQWVRGLPGVRPEHLIRSRLGGHPISCRKLRRRVRDDEEFACTDCSFAGHPADYPSPALHADHSGSGRSRSRGRSSG